MHENKYLFICCCALVLFAITARQAKIKDNLQAHIDGSVVREQIAAMPEAILLEEKAEAAEVIPPATVVAKPYISAESYLVGNLETGELYNSLNADKVSPIASVSKLYTALVVEHLFDPDKEITITKEMLDAGYGDAGHLLVGEKFSPNELLYPLLLESSNDAAEAYAQSFGYSQFMEAMNAFAKEIGMNSTSFKDASGLNPRNVSNTRDLFTLARYLYEHEKDILKISDTPVMDLATTTDHRGYHFTNINPYAFYSGFIGGKTGRTDEAKESMISLFRQEIGNESYPIAIIILRSEFGEREEDTKKLLGMFMDKL